MLISAGSAKRLAGISIYIYDTLFLHLYYITVTIDMVVYDILFAKQTKYCMRTFFMV
jgi:hypothetical protein